MGYILLESGSDVLTEAGYHVLTEDGESGGSAVGAVLSGPTAILVGSEGTYEIQPRGADTDTITISDNGGGGTITGSPLTWSDSSLPLYFTYSNATPGTYSLTATSTGGATITGSPLTVVAYAAAPKPRWFPMRRRVHHRR